MLKQFIRWIKKTFHLGPYKPIHRASHKIVAKDTMIDGEHYIQTVREVRRSSLEELNRRHLEYMCNRHGLSPDAIEKYMADFNLRAMYKLNSD